jgi:hypothetical protein
VRKNGAPWSAYVCSSAALNGQLEVLKWARANGAPWNEWTCAYAAGGGHLEVLKWVQENGAPWDGFVQMQLEKGMWKSCSGYTQMAPLRSLQCVQVQLGVGILMCSRGCEVMVHHGIVNVLEL